MKTKEEFQRNCPACLLFFTFQTGPNCQHFRKWVRTRISCGEGLMKMGFANDHIANQTTQHKSILLSDDRISNPSIRYKPKFIHQAPIHSFTHLTSSSSLFSLENPQSPSSAGGEDGTVWAHVWICVTHPLIPNKHFFFLLLPARYLGWHGFPQPVFYSRVVK